MKVQQGLRCLTVLSVCLILSAFFTASGSEAAKLRAPVGTETCTGCHIGWHDNNPPLADVVTANAAIDYLPMNFAPRDNSFYFIPEAYQGSIHASPAFAPNETDYVTCEACHGSGAAHFGLGPIPNPIPQTSACISCHKDPYFDSVSFLATSHANPNKSPKITFDQRGSGTKQAKIKMDGLGQVSLFKANESPVTRNERIEECSACHSYALHYPQFQGKIANGSYKKLAAEVSCGACHDAHIPAPNANDPATVSNTVQVATIAGTSTVSSFTPAAGREMLYLNHKPYKIDETTGAQSTGSHQTRGSAIARPSRTIVSNDPGTMGTLSSDGAISNRLTYAKGGFWEKVKPYLEAGRTLTLFISGQASGTGNLPGDAAGDFAGAPVTVQATLDKQGFEVEEVINDTTLLIKHRTEADSTLNPVIAQLGNADIAAVVKSTVTYKKAPSGTAGLSVFVPFIGSFNFEIRDMRTNTENLCGSCHAQGTYKYTAYGATKDGTVVDLASSHNNNIMAQYKNSGHADYAHALAWAEFSAFEYGSHQPSYPFDMSITGSGGVGSLRNGGSINYQLTTTPNPANAYLSQANNTTLPVLNNNYSCNQCHHGLGSIDYQLNRHGTEDASVLWGDATVTCITCHDPHSNGVGSNVRTPVYLSFNSYFTDGRTNRMLDGTAIPAGTGTSTICLFCHQGRESGWTVYKYILSRGVADPYATPGQNLSTGSSFRNGHYLAAGGILWSKNAWEYFFNGTAQLYSGNASHQAKNCTGCHMGVASAENTEGGHSWNVNFENCQACHNGMNEENWKTFQGSTTAQDIDALTAAIIARFAELGIQYDPGTYPYFSKIGGGSITWNTNTMSAAFDLNLLIKTKEGIYAHNTPYTLQILWDSLQAIEGVPPAGLVRRAGTRAATDYRTITP